MSVYRIAEMTKPFLSLGNQYGEGWFLAGEMIELITHGTPNVVCIQPFACLPNHVVGKGVIKALKKAYPQSNIAAVDYDPGASEVNQLNRIKLMLSTAKKNIGLDGLRNEAKRSFFSGLFRFSLEMDSILTTMNEKESGKYERS